MKKIEAIIRKSKFDEVKKALHSTEVVFFTYWDVTGVGNEKQGHVYRVKSMESMVLVMDASILQAFPNLIFLM